MQAKSAGALSYRRMSSNASATGLNRVQEQDGHLGQTKEIAKGQPSVRKPTSDAGFMYRCGNRV